MLLTQTRPYLSNEFLQVLPVTLDENGGNTVMASQLNNIRLKLEEKRRHIENEKRRMEVVMSKQRQKVGKAAFLQAVTKVKRETAKPSLCVRVSVISPDCVIHITDLLERHYRYSSLSSYTRIISTSWSELEWFVSLTRRRAKDRGCVRLRRDRRGIIERVIETQRLGSAMLRDSYFPNLGTGV